MTRRAKAPESVRAWAWMLNNGLCYWAMPTQQHLDDEPKPSPEARKVCVRLVLNADYRRLLRAAAGKRKP